MDKFQAVPLKSVGEICFGMTRREVRNIFSIEAKEFKKTKFNFNFGIFFFIISKLLTFTKTIDNINTK